MNPQDRYWYSIKKIADTEEYFVLKSDDDFHSNDSEILIWPEGEFAELYGLENNLAGSIEAIELDSLIRFYIKKMTMNHESFEVFATPSERGCIQKSDKFALDINSELKEWYG